jgi:CheY-like chemotaxis protein
MLSEPYTYTIGVVDDEVYFVEYLKEELGILGFKVILSADNYLDTINYLNTTQPDVMLLDIRINGEKDGIDIADYINQNFKIPIIMLTANRDATTTERLKAIQPSATLSKPIGGSILKQAIQQAITNV